MLLLFLLLFQYFLHILWFCLRTEVCPTKNVRMHRLTWAPAVHICHKTPFLLACSYNSCKFQVGASFTLADCVTMYTCERNASGAYLVETTLTGCNQYEQCLLVDGDHTCVCDAEHIMIDGVCQRELFLSISSWSTALILNKVEPLRKHAYSNILKILQPKKNFR